MFPAGDPRVVSYRQLQSRLGGESVVLAVYEDERLLTSDGLLRLKAVSDELAEVEGVQAVLSLANIDELFTRVRQPLRWLPFGVRENQLQPLLDPTDSLAVELLKVFEGYTHNAEGNCAAIACMLESDKDASAKFSREPLHLRTVVELRASLRLALQNQDESRLAESAVLVGEPVLVADGYALVQRDGYRLGIVSSIVVGLVLLMTMRSVRWMVAPLIFVFWAFLVTQGSVAALGLKLTMISSTVNSVLTVVGVATCTHLILSFEAKKRKGAGTTPEAALEESLSVLIVPIMWACVTDALGFGSLLAASVGPVRDFGLMMSMGVGAVFVGTLLLFPTLALAFNRPHRSVGPEKPSSWLKRSLDRVAVWAIQNRRAVLSSATVLGVVASIGCFRLQVETDFTKNFSQRTEIVRGYQLAERKLGGAGVWDVMLPAPAELNTAYIEQLTELQNQLRKVAVEADGKRLKLTKVLSIADAIEATSASRVAGLTPLSIRLAAIRATLPAFAETLFTLKPDENGLRWTRVMLRSPEQAPAGLKADLIHEVESTVTEFANRQQWTVLFPAGSATRPSVTGYHVLLCSLVGSVLSDQWVCFALATAFVWVAVLIATRSIRLACIALIPNGLPILMVLGCLGLAGQPVNLGAALIAAVSIGLSVDSSIHYLLHYQRTLADEGGHDQLTSGGDDATPPHSLQLKAALSAQKVVGQAAVVATLALAAGFLALASSEFKPTVAFGTLACITMLGGLLGNLVILPALLSTQPDA